MRIAILTHNFPATEKELRNAGIFVYEFAEEMAGIGDTVWIYCPGMKTRIEKLNKGLSVYWFKQPGGGNLGDMKISSPIGLLKLLVFFLSAVYNMPVFVKNAKADVNFAMWAWPSGLFAYLMKKIYQKPYAIWALGSDINIYARMPIMGWIIKKILANADHLYADGIELRGEVELICGKKCDFLASSTRVSIPKKRTKKDQQKLTLTFLGRMEEVKGPDILLDALMLLQGKRGDLNVNFIGDGSMFNSLRTKANNSEVRKYVRFYTSDRSLNAKRMAESDWVVIPSRSDSIPLVFSEAMKVGVPVLCSDLPDISYIIKKYDVGILYKANSPESLAKEIIKLRNNGSEYSRLRKNTSFAAREFSLESSASIAHKSLSQII